MILLVIKKTCDLSQQRNTASNGKIHRVPRLAVNISGSK
jgi:hypothetical protein